MKNSWVRARVREASDRSYSDAVLPLLEQARKEIVVSLYLIEPEDSGGPGHPVNRLLESIFAARRRGVHVQIYLNTNFRFRPKTDVGKGKYFERLLEAGTELTALLPGKRLHDKLIVIDGRYVVEGSMNWSVSALASNYESVSIIDSPAHARKKLERIERFTQPPPPSERQRDRPLLSVPETVEISKVLFDKTRLPRMIRESDARTFDLYLLLLGQAAARGKRELDLDLETLGRALALPSGWNRSTIRRQVIKVLRKLADHYALLEVEFPYARDAQIRLKQFLGGRVQIPGWLFDPDYLGQNSSPVTFLALAGEFFKKEGVAIDSVPATELEKRFGIGRGTFLSARAASRS